MRITTKLTVAALIPVGMALMIVLSVFLVSRQAEEARERGRIAGSIMQGVAELNQLTYAYLLYGREGPKVEFLAKHGSLTRRIEEIRCEDRRQQELVNEIREDHGDIRNLFITLASGYEARRGEAGDAALFAARQERLADQILLRSRSILSRAFLLGLSINQEADSVQQKTSRGILLLTSMAALAITGILLRVMGSISRAIHALQEGTRIIGSGDFDYKVRTDVRDEIGQLSQAFDRMTEQLKTVTVSRNFLQKEIEERKRVERALRRSEDRLKEAQRIASLGNWEWNLTTGKLKWSDEIYHIMGVSPQNFELSPESCLSMVHPDDRLAVEQTVAEMMSGQEKCAVDYRVTRKDGAEIVVQIQAEVACVVEGRQLRIVGTVQDITERKALEEAIRYQANHDLLTGLPNRMLFTELLILGISQASRSRKRLAVLFLDLDRFKNINDSLGHHAGDQLLKEVAVRLLSPVRESDTVARMGGDEFVLLLPDIVHAGDVDTIVRKIMDAFQTPFSIGGNEVHISTSIGVSVYPDAGEYAEELIKNADIAMYYAKEQGRSNYQFYSPEMNIRTLERMILENSLRQTLDRGELVVYYQPQVESYTCRIVSAEALVRWQHPDLGLLNPLQFIPIAEETGLIMSLDEWVLRTACAQIREWQEEGCPAIGITVNLSARQFQKPGLAEMLFRILRETGLDPACLWLEITEGIAMKDVGFTIQTLGKLAEGGIRFSLDDFGTGYSSLSYLKRLPVQKVKIDKSFVSHLAESQDDRAIIAAVITLSHSLHRGVIAEGVETREQLEILRAAGCDEVQGFLFGKPVPAEAFKEMLLSCAPQQGMRAD
ncbi:MAG: EAL domain-containing protein [Nitrospirales bacterium]|nr:EAL domain-containing protein [Nitrospirales bacterium]